MKKLLKIITGVTLSLAMAIGVGIGVANNNKKAEPLYATIDPSTEEIAFILTAKSNNSDSDNSTEITTGPSNLFTNGSTYLFAASSSKVYLGASSSNALKFGSSSSKGTMSLTLKSGAGSQTFAPTKVVFSIAMANDASQKVNLSLNGATSGTGYNQITYGSVAKDFSDYEVAWDGETTLTSISVEAKNASKNRFYLSSISVVVAKSSGGGDPDPNPTYTVTYDANGGTGTMTDSNSPYEAGATVTVLANSFTWANHSFSRWNTQPNGSGTYYDADDTFTINANTTLYAQWIDNTPYSVTYHNTNATGGNVPTDNTEYHTGNSITVAGNTGSLVRTGYTWSGWSLNENGSGTAYGPTYTTTYTVASSNVNFYPIWAKNPTPLPESGTISITGENPAIAGSYGTDVSYSVEEDSTPDSVFSFKCTNIMKRNSDLQFRKTSDGAGTLYSTTPLSYLRSVVVSGDNNGDAVITYGKSQNSGCTLDDIGTDNTYFKITNSANGVRYWTITVTYSLSDPELTGLRISDGLESVKKNYDAGENFDPTGLIVQAQWDSEWDTVHNVVDTVVWSPNPLTSGTTSVTGTYSAGGNSETVTVTGLSVIAPDYVIDGDSYKPAGVSSETNTTVGNGLSNGIQYGYYALQTYNTNLEFNKDTLGAYLGNNESYGKYISRVKVTLTAAVAFDRLTMYKGDSAIPGTTIVSANVNTGTVRSFNFNNDSEYFVLKQTTTGNWNQIVKIEVFLGSNVPVVDTVSASIENKTYYAGSTLSSSDFDVTVSWTEGKADTHPTEGFTWTVNGVANGTLVAGSNSVVVTYEGASTDPALTVVAQAADPKDIVRNNLTTRTTLAYHYNRTDNTVTDAIDRSFTGVNSGAGYSTWSDKTGGQSSVVYAGQSAGGNNSIQLRTDNNNSGIVSTANSRNRVVKRVLVSWNSNTANGRSIDIYGKNTAYTAATNLYSNDTQGTKLGSIAKGSTELIITGDYKFVGIRSASGALYLDEIQIEWSDTTTYTYSNVSIRFGGLISKALWDELDTNEHIISGFGVMIASGDALNEDEYIKNNLNSAVLADANPAPSIDNADIVDYYMSKAEMATPVESGDNYFWNLFQTVDEADINKVFVAVAYIKVGDEYVFMNQVRYSVKTLAADYLANRGCNAQTADGSLSYLVN